MGYTQPTYYGVFEFIHRPFPSSYWCAVGDECIGLTGIATTLPVRMAVAPEAPHLFRNLHV